MAKWKGEHIKLDDILAVVRIEPKLCGVESQQTTGYSIQGYFLLFCHGFILINVNNNVFFKVLYLYILYSTHETSRTIASTKDI